MKKLRGMTVVATRAESAAELARDEPSVLIRGGATTVHGHCAPTKSVSSRSKSDRDPQATAIDYEACTFRNSGTNTSETMHMSLIRMLSDGPLVSLNGSPTVSPTTAAL